MLALGQVKIGDTVSTYPDRGFSFCNCKSIWFTNWENIDHSVEHEDDCEEFNRYMKDGLLRNEGYGKNRFFSESKATCAEAERLGFRVGDSMYNLIWSFHDL